MIRAPHRSRLRSPRTSQRGVVLLEVLVAILIFSFGILGTVGLLARATQFSVNAEDRNRAALLANELISSMWTAHDVNVNTTAWRSRVDGSDGSGAGLPNVPAGYPIVAVDAAASAATITMRWRAVSGRAGDDNQYVTQVAIP